MRTLVLWALALGLSGGAGAAEPLAPGQFAQGFALQAPPGGAVYSVDLTEPVYRALTRVDLGDLAVFNSAGEAVPQAFQAAETAPEAPFGETPLAHYTLSADAAADPGAALGITLDDGGTVIAISAQPVRQPDVRAWVVDTAELAGTLRGLRLAWNPGPNGFIHAVNVYASNDLHDWYYLAQGALADLDQDGHRLRRDTIEFAAGAARFLRIDWPGENPPDLNAILGLRRAQAPELARSYSLLRGTQATAPETGWVFDTGGPVAIERLRIPLPGNNNLAELRVWSRAEPAQPWTDRGRVLVYRVYADGVALESDEAVMPATRDRYWRLDSATGDANALGADPELLAGWRADSLVFIARGNGPFSLAAGSATAVAAPQAVGSLLQSIDAGRREDLQQLAWIGEQHELGGAQALQPPVPPVPWQRYLMWGLLVAGVLAMLRMALTLLRQGTPAAPD